MTGRPFYAGGRFYLEKEMIATSCWHNKPDPVTYFRIGISRGVPRGMAAGFRKYPKLNPGPWFNSVDENRYRELYYAEVLAPLDPEKTVTELLSMAEGKIPTLLCWEPATPGPKWCHRGFVAEWLFDTLSLQVYEVGKEAEGFGHSHPKLPPSMRLRPTAQI